MDSHKEIIQGVWRDLDMTNIILIIFILLWNDLWPQMSVVLRLRNTADHMNRAINKTISHSKSYIKYNLHFILQKQFFPDMIAWLFLWRFHFVYSRNMYQLGLWAIRNFYVAKFPGFCFFFFPNNLIGEKISGKWRNGIPFSSVFFWNKAIRGD